MLLSWELVLAERFVLRTVGCVAQGCVLGALPCLSLLVLLQASGEWQVPSAGCI